MDIYYIDLQTIRRSNNLCSNKFLLVLLDFVSIGIEMEFSMTSSVSNVEVTLENVKRKFDETMNEPIMAKKTKTKQCSILMDAVKTDGDDEDDDDDGRSSNAGSGDGTDDGDDNNDNTILTSNNSGDNASTTRSKDHMVDVLQETRSTTKTIPTVKMTATSTRELKMAERLDKIECPLYGQIVNRREFRRAGPYLIGLKLGHSPVDSIVQYLAKKENSNEFYQLKILVLNNNTSNDKLLQDERQGKMLLHTEYSLLSLLENQDGVMQQHGLFSVSQMGC